VKNMRVEHIDHWVERVAEVRDQTVESQAKYRDHIVS
jgi:hypothetical protein